MWVGKKYLPHSGHQLPDSIIVCLCRSLHSSLNKCISPVVFFFSCFPFFLIRTNNITILFLKPNLSSLSLHFLLEFLAWNYPHPISEHFEIYSLRGLRSSHVKVFLFFAITKSKLASTITFKALVTLHHQQFPSCQSLES